MVLPMAGKSTYLPAFQRAGGLERRGNVASFGLKSAIQDFTAIIPVVPEKLLWKQCATYVSKGYVRNTRDYVGSPATVRVHSLDF